MATSFGKFSDVIRKVIPIDLPREESEEEAEEEEVEGKQDTEKDDDSDFYDTDLDGEDRANTPYDGLGMRTYNRSCRKMKINPVGAVQKGLAKTEIRVKGRGMDHRDALAICSALLGNNIVTSLIVDDNKLGWVGVGYIALMMCENEVILNLSLAKNQIGTRGCRAVMEMLLENDVLTSLNLSGNNIENSDIEFIASIIKDNRHLTYLNLSHNNISDQGAMFLQPAIADNETLRTLDLSWNKIRPMGGIAISEGLAENVVMSSLSLAYNGLCIMGARAMGECLQINEILTDLDLTCNRMFDEGVAFIAKALSTNETLKKLRISNNAMTTASVITVLTTIQENPDSAMVLLDMSNMHIYKEALGLANDIMFSNPAFKFLYGGIVNSDDANSGSSNWINNKHPMKILREFMVENNLRITDLFKQLDRDSSGTISRDEFITGLQSYDLVMSNAQVDRLMEILDTDRDGEVSISEFLAGDRDYRRKQLIKKQADVSRLRQERQARRLMRLQAQATQEKQMGKKDIPREVLHVINKMLLNSHKK